MSNIVITMKDGTKREFLHVGRSGGSYTKTLTLKEGFAIVEDEYGRRTIFPSHDISHINETPERGY
jgi:hypothetical protein